MYIINDINIYVRKKLDTQLVCTFTQDVNLADTVHNIANKFEVVADKLYLYSVQNNTDNFLLSYNIRTREYKKFLSNSILVHRKKETNTIYTINALNHLIRNLNGGIIDKKYPIKWEEYSDTIILQKYDELHILPIRLIKVMEITRENK